MANIVKHSQVKSAPLRARDLRANIQELGFEKGVEMTLTLLLDEWVGVRQQIKEMADIQSQTIDQLTVMANIGEGMAKRIASLKAHEEQFDESRGSGIVSSGNN